MSSTFESRFARVQPMLPVIAQASIEDRVMSAVAPITSLAKGAHDTNVVRSGAGTAR